MATNKQMLDGLSEVYDDLSTWEMDFIDSLSLQLQDGRNLSDRQMDRLEDLYDDKVLGSGDDKRYR